MVHQCCRAGTTTCSAIVDLKGQSPYSYIYDYCSYVAYIYLLQGSYVFARVCLFVCVSKITQKIMDGSFWNFLGMSTMAKTTSDSILGVIRKESWVVDHFEVFVNIASNGA